MSYRDFSEQINTTLKSKTEFQVALQDFVCYFSPLNMALQDKRYHGPIHVISKNSLNICFHFIIALYYGVA